MNIQDRHILQSGNFGLERETLRVDRRSLLPAVTDHPFADHPNVSKDFCEAQLELISPVCSSTGELMEALGKLDAEVREAAAKHGELLWMNSNPPSGYDVKKIRVASFKGKNAPKEAYRRYLLEKYGIHRMLLSGIHFNFSFSEEAMALLQTCYGETEEEIYLKLAAFSMKYAWLIVFLTAASPGRIRNRNSRSCEVSSVRCSTAGYWNQFIPHLDYTSLDAYCNSIEELVRKKLLYSCSELYLPVRLKPRGENNLSALRAGISHIELRMLDINPLAGHGIVKEDLDFIHLLLLMWAMKEPIPFYASEQEQAVKNMQQSVLLDETGCWIQDPKGIFAPVRDAALAVLAEMDLFYESWQDAEILRIIQIERRRILDPEQRYVRRIMKECASCLEYQRII